MILPSVHFYFMRFFAVKSHAVELPLESHDNLAGGTCMHLQHLPGLSVRGPQETCRVCPLVSVYSNRWRNAYNVSLQVILNSESCPTVEVATLHGGTNADVSIIPTPSGADAQNQGPSMGSLEILGGPLCTSTDSIKAKDAENESGLAERRESNTLAANYDGEGATTWRRRAAIAVGPSYAVFQTACASSGFEIYVDLETKSATNLVVRAFKRSVKISHVQSVASSSGPKEVLIKLPRSIIPQTAQPYILY